MPDRQRSQDKAPRPRPPLIRLVRDQGGNLVVTPAEPEEALPTPSPPPPFQPFRFPRLPLSLHCWLTGLGAEFQRRHARCLAALLILHHREARWVRPVLPAQVCGERGASWTLDLGEHRPAAHHCIGGSFQVRTAIDDVFEAAETVPPLDGLHVVQNLKGQTSMAYCFLRAEGVTSVLPAGEAMEDDWDTILAAAGSRMTLE